MRSSTGFEPSVPRLRGRSARLAARDATDAAIAKLGTPVVRANELDERFAASRSLGRVGSVGENSDEGDSLIRAEISLIADLNSLQGRKKFPVRVRRELARKALVLCAFLLRLTHSRGSNR